MKIQVAIIQMLEIQGEHPEHTEGANEPRSNRSQAWL